MSTIGVLHSGSLGFFWKIGLDDAPDLESDPERGYVTTEGGWAVLDVLDEDPLGSGPDEAEESPRALVGIMPEEAALFLEVQGPWATRRFGGHRASSRRYRARTVIGRAPVGRIRTPLLFELQAHFHGIGHWAGMTAVQEDTETKDGLLQSWTVTLSAGEDLSSKLPGSRTLVLSTTWRVDGPPDKRTMSAPVTIGCKSRSPVEVWELLQPILSVQDLLGFAFSGFVPAEAGSALLDVATEDNRYDGRPSLWNGALMVGQPGVLRPKSMTSFPFFDLPTIGGIAGLARWIRLSLTHPRATNAVVVPYRYGPTSPAVTVMELASGIEYWVKANRPAAWAKGELYAQAVAGRCGRAFSEWVGNPELWGQAFWASNNYLKHEPTYTPDQVELADLAMSARFLLGAALLNRAAGSSAPSRAIFRNPNLADLGRRLRDRYR